MNPINGLFKVLYWPTCRAYSRHLGDRPADALLRFLCSIFYWRVYRFWPNFVHPRRFTEKVWNRMLYERDPLYTLISDKFRVRDYIADKVGGEYLITLLWSGKNPEEIPFDTLPDKFVIKTNHGCEYNIIIQDKTQLNKKKIIMQLKKWLGENFGNDMFLGIAWAYRNIKPHIIIETFLEENGHSPVDYKFFCFSGRVEYFKIDFDRFKGHSVMYFDRDFNKLDLFEPGFKKYQGKIDLPRNIYDLMRLAESLATGFDFIRVDLYSIEDKIYFSELTLYPGGVFSKFEPDYYDYVLGEKWKWK